MLVVVVVQLCHFNRAYAAFIYILCSCLSVIRVFIFADFHGIAIAHSLYFSSTTSQEY